MSIYQVPAPQERRFKVALAERLGLNLSEIVDLWAEDNGTKHVKITVEAILPAEEVRDMFNDAGKAP